MADLKRSYDSSRRREQAQRNYEAVLGAGRRRFLSQGSAATTIVFGINVPWWVFSVIGGGLALLISLIGIQLSTRIDLGLAIIADLVLLVTSIAIVAKVASAGHLSLSSLTPGLACFVAGNIGIRP